MNISSKLIIIISLLITTSCGFQVSNNALYGEYYIENIQNMKTQKIDFLIKQGLRNKRAHFGIYRPDTFWFKDYVSHDREKK